jgi:hypothetical protein
LPDEIHGGMEGLMSTRVIVRIVGRLISAVLFLVAVSLISAQSKPAADLLITNANIWA